MADHESHTPVSEDDLFPGASTSTSVRPQNSRQTAMTSSPPPSQDPTSQLSQGDAPRPVFIPSSPSISRLPDGRLVHQPSGYTWSREEDAPGYSWMSKRATDDYQRAVETIVDREKGIGIKYGDIGLEGEGGATSQKKK